MTDHPGLLERIERLEVEVARLKAEIDRRADDAPVETLGHLDLTGPPTPPADQGEKPPPHQAPDAPKADKSGPKWLGAAGGALFFLGMIFVYRYSVEQGLLTPFMRIVIGYLTGAGLFLAGIRLRPRWRGYGVTLEGTGLALLYGASYAATFFYQLVSRDVAFLLMDLVSLVAVTASVKQKEQTIAVAGLSAALATPFLLGSDHPDVGSLALYAAGMALVAAIVHHKTGWRTLMGVVTVGVWGTILASAALQMIDFWGDDPAKPMVQTAMVLSALTLWGAPLWRRIRDDDERPLPHVALLGFVNGFPLLIGSAVLWDWENGATALAAFGLAALFFGGGQALRHRASTEVSFHLAGGHIATLIGLALAADALTDEAVWGSALWALYAAGLVYGGVRFTRPPMVKGGLAILAFTAVKLILADFAEGSLLVRAVVFLGVGGLALALHYWLLPHWREKE